MDENKKFSILLCTKGEGSTLLGGNNERKKIKWPNDLYGEVQEIVFFSFFGEYI